MDDETRLDLRMTPAGIGRRDFVIRAGALALGAAGISGLGSSVSLAQAVTPRRGGRARIAMDSTRPDENLDPERSNTRLGHARQFTLYNPLVRISANLTATPELAVSWESTSNATEWVFRLRKGVAFHNGKPMTSADVVHSLRRHTGPKSESWAKPYMATVTDISAQDAYTVRVVLSAPNVDFPLYLGLPYMMIVPDGFEGHDFDKNGIGTGPFKLKEFKPAIRGVFVRNENYWKEGLPYLDEVELFAIPDTTARTNALLAGEIDLMGVVDPKTLGLLQKAPGIDIVSAKGNANTLLAMMVDRGAGANPDCRLAMKFALDRERVLQNIYKGHGQIGNDHPIAPNDLFYCGDIQQRGYDLDRARFHIRKAGLENQEIALYTAETPGPGALELAVLFQQSAAPAGINIKVIQVPAETFWPNTWLKQSFIVSGWVAHVTPDVAFTDAFTKGDRRNETHWANDRFQSLMIEARGVADVAKRKEMYCEMQRLLHDDGGSAGPCFYNFLDAKPHRVQGVEPHPLGNLSGYQVCERMWLAS